MVRPGGLLAFSVCTIEPDEGDAVVSGFLAAHSEFDPVPIFGWPLGSGGEPAPPAVLGREGTAYLLPHVHDTDGFFVAALRRRR